MEFVNTLKNLGYIKKNLRIDDIFDLTFGQEVHPEPEHYSK